MSICSHRIDALLQGIYNAAPVHNYHASSMKLILRLIATVCIVLAPFANAADTPTDKGNGTAAAEQAVARVGAEALTRDASLTQQNVVKAVNALLPKGTPVDYNAKIDSRYWGPVIRGLKPQYVYFDGVNIAIILQTTAATESGLYVVLPFSSTGFNAADKGIWSGKLITNSIYAVTRKGKHNKGVQRTP